MRVLVVDDSAAVRARLVALLREAGHEVVGEAATATAALAMATVRVPDAVLLDVHLPDRSGLEVLAMLRARAEPPLVVILTNEPSYRRRCLALGADAFLDKSIEFDDVAGILASARVRPPAA